MSTPCNAWSRRRLRRDRERESQPERIAMFRENVDKILRQLDTKQGPGLAVWVALDDQVIYANWAGLAQRQPRLAIQGDTAFELASASKPLTATLAMQLVEAGLLGLDDSVRQWLPSLPASWSDMTVRHLLTHRAGIPDYMKQINAEKLIALDGLTNEKLLQRWQQTDRLNFAPGSSAEYSNSNYVLLAEIIAKACARLKQDRFACFVVGEVRDKKGNYYDLRDEVDSDLNDSDDSSESDDESEYVSDETTSPVH